MKLLKLEQTKIKNIYKAIVESNGNELFRVNTKLQIDSKNFVVQNSKVIGKNGLFEIFQLELGLITQETFHDVSNINFLNVSKIKRENSLKIVIQMSAGGFHEFGYRDEELCMKDYVIFQRIWRESASGYGQQVRFKY